MLHMGQHPGHILGSPALPNPVVSVRGSLHDRLRPCVPIPGKRLCVTCANLILLALTFDGVFVRTLGLFCLNILRSLPAVFD